ncbi:TonB-dependent receptor [Rhizorhabdus wittichii RW1]|uniref:TonB-dependent receptor n=1 Tax=Rhizorhabdus wittichii (strain DSM 6014 / CCUG 31198 / JCM 15750 / NBRC 105917 / EY 4224 / RW1) TaxID=392499 RepID=A0A9J9HAG9_RHIWR|nr:TonB-dependent receptor [Rhizorhabdus wittichii RW1]
MNDRPHIGQRYIRLFGLTVSLVALALGQQAQAQKVTQPAADQAVNAADADEILVTAQRRTQNILDVPIAITAFSGNQLNELGVRDARQLGAITPGLMVKPSLSDQNLVFTIRGVGINSFFAANNPSTSVYVNQVPLSFSPMLAFQMFDIERIEVLKGPQGTLYGRNTTSGAVNFITRKPSADWNGFLQGDYGRYDDLRLEGAVGGPVAPGLNFRLAATTRQRGTGWQFNRVTGKHIGEQHYTAGRFQLGWEPSDNLNILLEAHGGRTRGDSLEYEHVGVRQPAARTATCAPFLAGHRAEGQCVALSGYFDPDNDPYAGDYNDPNSIHTDTYGASATVEWNLPTMTLTAIGGHEYFKRRLEFDGDGSPFAASGNRFDDKIKSTSTEVRLSSNKEWSFEWILGATYSHDDIGGDFLSDATSALNSIVSAPYEQKTDAYAAYANVIVPLVGRLKLNGGLRYTHEKRSFLNVTRDLAPYGTAASQLLARGICRPQSDPSVAPVICSSQTGSFSNSDLSWTAGLDYKLEGDGLVYAKVSKGFKSGGINAAINFGASGTPFKPETLYAYETGLKGSFLDRRLRYSTAVYYYDWRDMQVFTLTQQGPLSVRVLTNAGQGEAYGAEGDLTYLASDFLTLTFGGNYNHTKIKKYVTTVAAQDATGNQFANSPKWTLFGLVKQQIPLGDDYRATVTVDANYRSSQFFEIANRPIFREPGYALVNARLAFAPTGGAWEIAFWAKNLFDKRYRVDMIEVTAAGAALNAYGEPRTYGASARYTF